MLDQKMSAHQGSIMNMTVSMKNVRVEAVMMIMVQDMNQHQEGDAITTNHLEEMTMDMIIHNIGIHHGEEEIMITADLGRDPLDEDDRRNMVINIRNATQRYRFELQFY
jgi:hypothetical protein